MSTAAISTPGDDDLREFFELSLSLWCIAGTDGYFKHLNPAWESTFGYSLEELLSRPYLDFVHPDDREATMAAAAEITTGRNILSFENRYRCKDGSYKWLLWSAIARIEKKRIYAIAADVTDRKCQEARLAAQYAVTRVLAEASTLATATPPHSRGYLRQSWLGCGSDMACRPKGGATALRAYLAHACGASFWV